MKHLDAKLQSIIDSAVDGNKIFGITFAVKNKALNWQGNSGDIKADQQFFIASIAKLFTTAIIMQLKNEGKISLHDEIQKFLNQKVLTKLHFLNGIDYTNKITIAHLLAHTSGIPDYFQGKNDSGISLEQQLTSGQDRKWTFDDAISISKTMTPLFQPGTPNKAQYSDTNYQLLGKIIEVVTDNSYDKNLHQRVIKPLNLGSTYLFSDTNDIKPKAMYYKKQPLSIPLAMTSFGSDGGIVSNTSDMIVFIEAFFNGELFPKQYLDEMQVWNKIFFPLKSGIGLHLFKLPRLLDPLGMMPAMIGHSGLSGAVAFYCPKKQTYIVGTVNQIAYPDKSFRIMTKLIRSIHN